jgi:hypothetical protein
MYRTIDVVMWTDDKVRKLPPDGKLLFLYLITNPQAHVSGIYQLARETMARQTGLTIKRVNTLCDRLFALRMCSFDAERDVVFVRRMAKYQGRGEKNEAAAVNQIGILRNSPLVNDFLAEYPSIKDKVSHTLSDPSPSQVCVGTQEQEQEQEQDTHTRIDANAECPTSGEYSPAFLLFWQAYPRKKDKGHAWKAWQTASKNGLPAIEAIVAKIVSAKRGPDWTKDAGQWIPYPASWINGRRWEDEDSPTLPLLTPSTDMTVHYRMHFPPQGPGEKYPDYIARCEKADAERKAKTAPTPQPTGVPF